MTTFTGEIRKVFVDSSAWIELANKNARFHSEAVYFHLSLDRMALRVTTWGIVAETYTWLRYHLGAGQAAKWLEEKESLETKGFLEVVFPEAEAEAGLKRILGKFTDQGLSYVDAFSLSVLQDRPDIDAVFSFDHHLALAGMPVQPGQFRRKSP